MNGFKARTLIFGAIALALLGCGSGGGGGGTSEKSPERMRIVHTAPDAGSLSVFLDEDLAVSELPYGEFTEYLASPEGKEVRVRVYSEDEVIPIVDEKKEILSGKDYSLYLLEEDQSDKVVIQLGTDTNTAPGEGQFRLRVGNFSPTNATFDVYLLKPDGRVKDSDPAAEGVAFKAFTKYFDIDQGKFVVKITPAGSKTVLLDTGELTGEDGDVRTLVVIEKEGGGKPLSSRYLLDSAL